MASPAINVVFNKRYLIPLLLFLLTAITTTIAGALWIVPVVGGLEVSQIPEGIPYSVSILAILGFHEFGHFFADRKSVV